MRLVADDYEFWTSITTADWQTYKETTILIGNPRGRPRPCMMLTIQDGFSNEAVLQDLMYYSTCSAPRQLERGAGTVAMVKSAFTAVMQRFPDISKIVLQDKSYYPDARRGNLPLPEYYALAHGQTWYQKHFGATPGDHRTAAVYQQYKTVRSAPAGGLGASSTTVAEHIAGLPHPTEPEFDDIRRRLKLSRLSGMVWEIPRAAVMQYGVRGEFVEGGNLQQEGGAGGGSSPWKRSPSSVPYYIGRVRP
jgi:hypothetical protein